MATFERGEERQDFHGVAAVVYYLRIVAWAIPEFTPQACEVKLRAAHDTPGRWPVPVRQRRFQLVATKEKTRLGQ